MLYVLALTVHIISVVLWIGGVGFVTMITFPMIQRSDNSLEQVMMFQGVEHRFSKIAKILVILTGLTGLFQIYEKGLSFGVWVMIVLWAVYAVLLFGLEKLIFQRLFPQQTDEQYDTKRVFAILQAFHWIVLLLSFFAIASGIWTAHY